MKIFFIIYLIVITFLLSLSSCVAQKKSFNISTIDGKKYYLHIVEKGQTLYGISKLYEVDKDIIEKYNQNIAAGLTLNQVLKIPVDKKDNAIIDNKKYKNHTVEKGQTLYSISKLYNLTVDDVLAANADLSGTELKPGTKLVIPNSNLVTQSNTIITTPIKTNETLAPAVINVAGESITTDNDNELQIALLLPLFSLNFNDSLNNTEKRMSNRSIAGLDFLQGVFAACDSLKKLCVNINISVFDVENDSAKTLQVIESKNLDNAQVVIGPFYTSSAVMVADYCNKKNKVFISPVSANNKVLLNNTKSYKIISSPQTQFEFIADVINSNYGNARVIGVYNDALKQKAAISHLAKKLSLTNGDSCYLINYKKQSNRTIESFLKKDIQNIVVSAVTEQAACQEVINKIKNLNANYNVKLFTGDQYFNFENIDYETYEKANFAGINSYYLNFKDAKTKEFIKHFRAKNNAEPTKYAFSAFDIVMWLGSSYNQDNSLNTLHTFSYDGLCTKIKFKKVGVENGYENQGLHILNFENLEIKKNFK